MRQIIQFQIYKGEKQYVGECNNLAIITQGQTLDELEKNIREAVSLHLEGEDLAELGLVSKPSILVNFELAPAMSYA